MSWWKETLRRVWYLGRRSRFDRELNDEIQFHIDTRAEELEQQGMPRNAAREQARREFGPRIRVSEDTRSAWQFQWLEDVWKDLRYAIRAAAKSPGFTAIAILSLALGVGVNFVIFMFVDEMLLRPMPVPQPQQVVTVFESTPQSGKSAASYPDYVDLRDRNTSFEGLMAFTTVNIGFAPRSGDTPHTKDGQLVTGNYFDVLGVKPALGRAFLPQEDQVPGRDAVVILSHFLWEREFRSDPEVLGMQAWIGGIAFTIVGVTPARFTAIDDDLTEDFPEYYVPLMMASRIGSNPGMFPKRDVRTLTILGRLKPGVAIAHARAEAATIAGNLEKQYPDTNRNRTFGVQTVLAYRTSGTLAILGIPLMILAGAVLLVACANVAGLLSSRAAERAKEIAMRLAIGASRARLIRQLLTESLLLAMAGGIAGTVIGYIPIPIIKRIIAQLDPNVSSQILRLDPRVFLFSMGAALLSLILFGLVPAFQTTRADLTFAMKGGAPPPRRPELFFRRLWGRHLLVAIQVAISVLLLTVSSLIYVGFHSVLTALGDSGFQTDHVLTMSFDPLLTHYQDAQARHFYDQLRDRVRAAAGIKSVTLASRTEQIPAWPEGLNPSDQAALSASSVPSVWADATFFDALAIPILKGRGLLQTDSAGAPAIAVVNESLAKAFWPGRDPIGKRIRVRNTRWVEVVGVAAIRNYEGIGQIPPPSLIFFPAAQSPRQPSMMLFSQSTGDRTALTASLRALVRELDSSQAVPEVRAWGENIEVFERGLGMITHLIGAMGAMGMLLALVGLYGLVAFDVSTRTREIGIRMALGAARGKVLRMVLLHGLTLSVCGIGLGWLLNDGVVHLIGALFPENFNSQPKAGGFAVYFSNWSYAGLLLAVLSLTMLAAYIPARRASRVDPNVALRCE
jgi:predicted permease